MKKALVLAVALLTVPAPAQASPADNSLQPGHVYMGDVHMGHHPTATVTYRNGTGRHRKIKRLDIAGSGSQVPDGNGVFQIAKGTTCVHGLVVPARGTCKIIVRVATSDRTGWFRSSLNIRLGFKGHIYSSAELRVHIVQ